MTKRTAFLNRFFDIWRHFGQEPLVFFSSSRPAEPYRLPETLLFRRASVVGPGACVFILGSHDDFGYFLTLKSVSDPCQSTNRHGYVGLRLFGSREKLYFRDSPTSRQTN
jgi:hypothetical protein